MNQAIRSIQMQSYPDFECILIDNNSTDQSRKIAEQWVQHDKRFRLTEEHRQGVTFASNKGFRLSQGNYVARMDADDLSLPDRLKNQADFLDNQPEIGVASGLTEYVNPANKMTGLGNYVNWVNSLRTHEEIQRARFVDAPVINPTTMWRRTIAEKLGMYHDGDFPEDYEMWLRWMEAGVRIHKTPCKVLKWTDSANRLTRTNPIYREEAFYQIKSKYLAKWLEDNNPHHPHVTIWGASKTSRKRAFMLEKFNVRIEAFIDIKKTRQINHPVIYHKELSSPPDRFILIYVKQWHAKPRIQSFLHSKHYREGMHYLFVS